MPLTPWDDDGVEDESRTGSNCSPGLRGAEWRLRSDSDKRLALMSVSGRSQSKSHLGLDSSLLKRHVLPRRWAPGPQDGGVLAHSPWLWARSEDRPAQPTRPSSLQWSPGPRSAQGGWGGRRAPGLQVHVWPAALMLGRCRLGPKDSGFNASLCTVAGLLQTPGWRSAEPRGRMSFGCFCRI